MSDCLKDHNRGFLVNTADKNETNLCEDCGQRFFNVSFEKQKKILEDNSAIRKQKLRLNKVLEQNSIREQVNELKLAFQGANWLYHVLTSFCDTYPMELLTTLKELAIPLSKSNAHLVQSLNWNINKAAKK